MTDQEVIDRFHLMWYHDPGTWSAMKWMGVNCMQNPMDIWMIQEIIWVVKPDWIVETGTAHGGSAALWAAILRQANPSGHVITIDTENPLYPLDPDVHQIPVVRDGAVMFLAGSSIDAEVIGKVATTVKDRRTLVILDSQHAASHVVPELEAYAPMVSLGSYLILQDTNLGGHPVFPGWGQAFGGGPWEALDAWLPKHPEFESDRSMERMLLHSHPRGYLKRIK